MADTSVIGRASFVRGRLTGDGDLEVAGRIEGEISIGGDIVVEATGLIAANIQARRIVVRGAVKGDLVAEELVALEATARVVGALRAPRIAIAQGGLVRGQITTTEAQSPRRGASAARASVRQERPAVREEPRARVMPTPAKPAPAPVFLPKAESKTEPKASAQASAASRAPNATPLGATLAGARVGPPPPVVPVLKKGTKAMQKKR